MKTNELIQKRFPFIFGDRENPILQTCRDFLTGNIDRAQFEAFVIRTNTELKAEDARLDELYRSGGMGRPGIMDGAPQVAQDFRLEIIQILDGGKLNW